MHDRPVKPRHNVVWGLANFLVASLLVWWQLETSLLQTHDVAWLLAGFWLAVLMFGFGIKQF